MILRLLHGARVEIADLLGDVKARSLLEANSRDR